MSRTGNDRPGAPDLDLGRFSRPEPAPRVVVSDVIAGASALLWLLMVGAYHLFVPQASADSGVLVRAMSLIAAVLPVALILVAAMIARTARALRAEAQGLQLTLDAMRAAATSHAAAARPASERLEGIAEAVRQSDKAALTFTSRREAEVAEPKSVAAEPAEEQPGLAFAPRAEDMAEPVPVPDFVRALNFPDSPDDQEGIRALRRALEDRDSAKLIRSAQDVLTLLGEDGIFMDDLTPDLARPEIWRKFAQGERGRAIAALGGVRDRSSLALTAGRMRQDPVFRDVAHHFLRQFDRVVAQFEKTASDQDLVALSDTRSARAFMLLGRVSGTFD